MDGATIAAFVIEFLSVIPALIYSVLSIYKVCTDGCLHFPFRACLIVICFRIYPHSIQFLFETIGVFANAKTQQVPYQRLLDALEVLEVYGTAYAQSALAIERTLAILDSKYERRLAERWKKAVFLLAMFCPGLSFSALITATNNRSTGKSARFLLLAAYSLTFVTMLITFRSSRRKSNKRHNLRLELRQRYATNENLKASTLYLPILLNELICEVIKTCLTYFVAPSSTTSKIMDIITAFQCLFFSSFLYHRHRRIMSKSSELSIFASPQATENYFKSYNAAWK